MRSSAAHLHDEEEVEYELALQISHLDLLRLLTGVQNATEKGTAPNNLSLRSGGDDRRLLCRPCSRSLETRVRQYASRGQGLVCASANDAGLPPSKGQGLCRLLQPWRCR